MSNYTKTTDFAAKDALLTGNPSKLVKGTEINTEFSNIQTAVNSKLDSSGVTAFAATLLDDIDAATARGTLEAAKSGALGSSGITGAAASGANTDITSLASPALAAATATTQGSGDNTTKVATTAMVQSALATALSVSAPVTLSGTSTDFTGIASTVKRLTVIFKGMSTNGTSNLLLSIGTSGGIESSGYTGTSISLFTGSIIGTGTDTTGALLGTTTAAAILQGQVTLYKMGANTWLIQGYYCRNDSQVGYLTSAIKTLGGTLDRFRLTTAGGTDAFDAGTVIVHTE